MTNDDPFGLENDAGRTRIRPANRTRSDQIRGLGRNDAAPVNPVPTRVHQTRANDNILVSSFSVLLGLAPELEKAHPPDNPEVLNARFHDNLVFSRDAAVSSGVPLPRADQAAWFVAALLDDIVLNTPWGASSRWPSQTLVTQLSGEVDAGDRFFEKVDDLMRFADRDPQLLELAYYCIALGFRGRLRIKGASGEAELSQLRDRMSRQLNPHDPSELSPHWRGVDAPDEPPRFAVPVWTFPIIALAVLTLVYVGLGSRLSTRAENLYSLSLLLPPPERAEIFRPELDTTQTEEVVIETAVLIELLPLFAEAAPTETVGALTGREDASLAIVVIQSNVPEVFRSAKADLNTVYEPLISSLAKVIADNIDFVGGVTVVGHTDSIPVQRSNPFQSNQGLSEARALTILEHLQQEGIPAELLQSEGRAASQPIADNGTPEGRARNRRIEIIVEKKI